MKIVAISRATAARTIKHRERMIETGIFKTPVEGAVQVSSLGIAGDVQVDRVNHGGPDKAVYAYTQENYRYWEAALQVGPFAPGHFGENLTVTGMPDAEVHIGDMFRAGSVLMQVTQPRVPCFKLGIKMGDPRFVGAFLNSGRVGFYLRVLEGGEICAGDPISRIARDPRRISIELAMRALTKGPRQKEIIEMVLSVEALSGAWREDLGKRLDSF